MLNFYFPPLAPVPHQVSVNLMKAAIVTAYSPFPVLAAPQLIGVSRVHIAAKISQDSNLVLTPVASAGICSSVLEMGSGNMLVGRKSLGACSAHYRRVFSETIGAAANLAVASNQGFGLFCTVLEFQELWGKLPTFDKFWSASPFSPDYICACVPSGDYVFLESKGASNPVHRKPNKFIDNKVQSMNLETANGSVISGGPVAWILGYSYLVPGMNLAIRWFNQRGSVAESRGCPKLALSVALLQFSNQLRGAGFFEFADGIVAKLRLAIALQSSVDFVEKKLSVEAYSLPSEHALRAAGLEVLPKAFDLFFEISEGQWVTDVNNRNVLAQRLSVLIQERQDEEGWSMVGARFVESLRD